MKLPSTPISRWALNAQGDVYRLDGYVGIGTDNPGGLLGLGDSSTYITINSDTGEITFSDAVNGTKALSQLGGQIPNLLYEVQDAVVTILKDLDGYASVVTESEHYTQLSEAIHQLIQAADAYGAGDTEQEHHAQQEQINQSILQALDGYASDITVSEHSFQLSQAIHDIISGLDGYATDVTVSEHYTQQSQINQNILQSLDGYATDVTVSEHYTQQSQINDTIIQALDGYSTLPISGSSGDGYIAFFTGSTNIAGDNDLYWDRVNNQLRIDGYLLPNTDNVHDIGSPTNRWQSLWLGPNSLHIRSTAAQTETGIERDWVLGADFAGNITLKQSNDSFMLLKADGNASIALGALAAVGTAINATAIGDAASATGSSSTAVGKSSVASGPNTTAFGSNSSSTASDSLALGHGSSAVSGAVAVGDTANSSATGAVTLGRNTISSASNSIAIGQTALSGTISSIAIGAGVDLSSAAATNNAVVGTLTGASTAAGVTSFGLGNNIGTGVANVTAIGRSAVASTAGATALGQDAQASNTDAIAIGRATRSGGSGSINIGSTNTTNSTGAILIGTNSSGNVAGAVSIGRNAANAGFTSTVAIGDGASVGSDNATAIGAGASAARASGTALGSNASATGTQSTGIGNLTISGSATATDTTAVGYLSKALVTNSVAIGSSSYVDPAASGIAIGKSATLNSGATGGITIGTSNSITPINVTAIGHSLTVATGGTSAVIVGTLTGSVSAANVTSVGTGNNIGAAVANITAIGTAAQATNTSATAVGHNSQATSTQTVAIGKDSVASQANTVAVGMQATASATVGCVAIGFASQASGTNGTTAVGGSTTASGAQSTAIGRNATVTVTNGTALGYNISLTAGSDNTAVGSQSAANNTSATAIGASSNASGSGTVSIGSSSTASGSSSTSIGNNSSAVGSSSVAIGQNAQAQAGANLGVLIGQGVQTTNAQVVAIGQSIGTNIGVSSVAVGYSSNANATTSVAIGSGANASSSHSVALGASSVATGANGTTALGRDAQATGADSTSIGHGAIVQGTNTVMLSPTALTASSAATQSVIVGKTTASITGGNVTAIGYNTNVGTGISNVTAVGQGAQATASQAVAVGQSSNATTNSVAVGGGAAASASASSVAIGFSSTSSGGNSTAVGASSSATNSGSTAIGQAAVAGGSSAVAVGFQSQANIASAISIGNTNVIGSGGGIAIGSNLTFNAGTSNSVIIGTLGGALTGASNTSLGFGNVVGTGIANVTAIGAAATANNTNATAVGQGASATAAGTTAVGQGSSALASNATAYGFGAFATAAGTVSVGRNVAATNTSAMAFGENSLSAGIGSITIGQATTSLFNNAFAIGQSAATDVDNEGVFGHPTTPINLVTYGSMGIGTPSVAQSGFKLQVAGDIGPNVDDAYSLGSETFRWKDGYFGPGTLHFIQNASENDTGANRQWNFGINSTGDLAISQDSSRLFDIFSSGKVRHSNPDSTTGFIIDPSSDGDITIRNRADSVYGGIHWGGVLTDEQDVSFRIVSAVKTMSLSSDFNVSWGVSPSYSAAKDVGIRRFDNGTLAITDGSTGSGALHTGNTFVDGYLTVGPLTFPATHNITMPDGASLAIYNTTDSVNYERGAISWSGNIFTIAAQKGGNGNNRATRIVAGDGSSLRIDNFAGASIEGSSAGFAFLSPFSDAVSLDLSGKLTSSNRANVRIRNVASGAAFSASSDTQSLLELSGALNQTGTAGYSWLDIAITENTIGSGQKRIIDARVNGINKFFVQSDGYIGTTGGLYVVGPTTLTGTISIAPSDGYFSPLEDDVVSLGSSTQRWKDLWLGSGTLHFKQNFAENDTGAERDWTFGIDSTGRLITRQGADTKMTLSPDSDQVTFSWADSPNTFFSIARQAGSTGSTGILDGSNTYNGIGITTGGVTGTLRGIWVNSLLIASNFGSAQTTSLGTNLVLNITGGVTWSSTNFTSGAVDLSIVKDSPGIARFNNFESGTQYLMVGHNLTDGYIGTNTGNIRIAPADNIVKVDGYILPEVDDAYSLGDEEHRWHDLWLGPGSLHIKSSFTQTDTGIERDWAIGADNNGNLSFKQDGSTWAEIDDTGTFHLGGPINSAIQLKRSAANTFMVASDNGSTNIMQVSTGATPFLLTGGSISYSATSGWIAQAGSYAAWLFQAQDNVQSARLIGSSDASGEYAARIGTKYSTAQNGNLSTLLQIGLDMDSLGAEVPTAEFYGDGRLSLFSPTLKTITLSHDNINGQIQTDFGGLVLAPSDGYVYPFVDDAYSLGSPALRWKDIWLGPGTLHFKQNVAENDTGVDRDWAFSIDSAGNLLINQDGDNAMKFASAGGTSTMSTAFTVSGSFAAPSFQTSASSVILNNLTFVNGPFFFNSGEQSVGLSLNTTFDQMVFVTNILSGRAVVFGEVAHYTKDYDHEVQGDPTIFIHSATDPDSDNTQWLGLYHDKTKAFVETGLGSIVLAPYDGYVLPAADDAYSVGSATKRWKDLWLGGGSLYFRQNAAENDAGIERQWHMGIHSSGGLIVKQANEVSMWVTLPETGSLALGYNADISLGQFNTAIGTGASASSVNGSNVAIGYNAVITNAASTSVAVGANASISSSGSSSVVVGYTAATSASNTTVIGYLASASASSSSGIAIGYNTSVNGGNAIAIGSSAPAIGANCIAIGVGTGGAGAGSVVIGTGAANGSLDAVAIGASSGIAADRGIAIGTGSSSLSSSGNGTGSVALGYSATADGGGIAIGSNAIASNTSSGSKSIAIGYGATTGTFTNALALGAGATVTANNEGQLGTAAQPLSMKTYGPMTIGGTDVGLRRGAAGILEISDGGAVNFGTLRMGAVGTTINSSGAVTFGAALHQMNDGSALAWGGNGGTGTIWYIDHSMAQLAFYLGSDISRSLVIGSRAAYAQDFDHSVQTDPAMFIHSATAPDTDNTQWLGFYHNKFDGYFSTGVGNIVLAPFNGRVVPGTTTEGLGDFDNRWLDGYFVDLNTKGAVNGIVSIENSDSPYLAREDDYTIICNGTIGVITVFLPSAGGGNKGRIYNIKKIDAINTITVQASGLENIDGVNLIILTVQYQSRQIQSDGSNWHIIGGIL